MNYRRFDVLAVRLARPIIALQLLDSTTRFLGSRCCDANTDSGGISRWYYAFYCERAVPTRNNALI